MYPKKILQNMKQKENCKIKIRQAIIEASNTAENNGKPSDFGKFFVSELRKKFTDSVFSNFTNDEFPLDILVDECCVIKIKNKESPHDNNIIQDIKTTVKRFELPGVCVNPDDLEKPLVDWYYYDEEKQDVVKENYEPEDVKKIQLEKIRKLQEKLKKENSTNNRIDQGTQFTDDQTEQSQTSLVWSEQPQASLDWSFDTALLVSGVATLVGMFVSSGLRGRRNNN